MAILPATWDMYDLIQGFLQAPTYHLVFELLLIVWIFKLLLSKSYAPERTVLTEKEKDTLIEEWTPEPLTPDIPDDHPIIQSMEKNMITGRPDKYVTINGRKCLNMATLNFLGMINDKSIEDKALKALRVYGVGSCGPRGFYGTMDVHLELEEYIAKFMNVEETILYSYGFATIASAIPAYSKRGDIIFCDAGVCFAIQKGLIASRSTIKFYLHNDMEDLERLLIEQQNADKKNPKKAKATRQFIIAEALSINYGDICPLPQLLALKWKYKVRIFLEESLSFGVLGKTGRGLTEHFNIDANEIDLIAACLENSIASIGGFCCGRKYVIDHQRLAGLGYCFSASVPPMLAAAAHQALTVIEEKPILLTQLEENCRLMHKRLSKLEGVVIVGDEIAPIKHIRMMEPSDDRDLDAKTLQMITEEAMEKNVALTVARYLEKEEHNLPAPSIRLAVNSLLTADEIENVVQVLGDCINKIMPRS